MNIFLLGFMGSGKTTVASKLAARLNLQCFDLDRLIEEKYIQSVSSIFDKEGEHNFRLKENKVLNELINTGNSVQNFVLSLGGGTPCFFDNMELINASGISVYLKLTPDALFSRLFKGRNKRPLIKNFNDIQLKQFISEKLSEREQFYSKAQITVNGFNLDLNNLIRQISSANPDTHNS